MLTDLLLLPNLLRKSYNKGSAILTIITHNNIQLK